MRDDIAEGVAKKLARIDELFRLAAKAERQRIATIIKARIASGILEPEFSMPAAIAAWIEDGAVDLATKRSPETP